MAQLEERVAKIEGEVGEMSRRLNHLEAIVGRIDEKVDRSFRWTIGVMLGVLIPMWVTIILTVLFKG